MVDEVKVKIYKVGSRHSINLPSGLVTDSAFPFKPNEELIAKIDGRKIIIEKSK
jgi:hypothetical protein